MTALPMSFGKLYKPQTLRISDDAWRSKTRWGGVGWVVRNHEGQFLYGGCSGLCLSDSALTVETLGLCDGLEGCLLGGWKKVVMETDAKMVIEYLQGSWNLMPLLRLSCLISKSCHPTLKWCCSLVYISRRNNEVAYLIATLRIP